MEQVVFLTGATGFIGINLIREILQSDTDTRIIALVRGESCTSCFDRLRHSFELVSSQVELEGFLKRVTVVCGDVCATDLGLSARDLHRVVTETTHIVHSAANVNFDTPLQEARKVNVAGTRNVLMFAQRARKEGRLERFGYIGTAFVSGRRVGLIEENQLSDGAGFTNSYEQTKFEAESFAREMSGELPTVIFRPSIVVGHSSSGATTSFNVLYTPLRLIQRKCVPALPGYRRVPLDVVPVDYVTKAIVHLMFNVQEAVGRTYHLTAGEQYSCTAGEILDKAVAFFNRRSPHDPVPRLRFLPPALFRLALRFMRNAGAGIARLVRIYEPYMTLKRCFDTTNSTRDLAPAGITPPLLTDYLDALLGYCMETNWGKASGRSACRKTA